jgi:DNA-binding transcriptional regulator YiaG
MTNFAIVLKKEIRRLARSEARAYAGGIKAASAQHRRDLAGLKRDMQAVKKTLAFLVGLERGRLARPEAAAETVKKARFSGRWLGAHRKRLRLSADDYAKLVGVSAQTVYFWERGRSKPRKAQLAAWVAIRGLGRREALRRLELLKEKTAAAAPRR